MLCTITPSPARRPLKQAAKDCTIKPDYEPKSEGLTTLFRIKANCSEQIEARVSQQDAYAFFSDAANFVAFLPNLESVTNERDDVVRWTIRAEVPTLGMLRVAFRVSRTDAPPNRIEFAPALIERENYLRCVATFTELGPALTRIKIAQTIDLRRRDAKLLHVLAAVIGPTRISAETEKQLARKLREFLQAAKTKLEK